MNAARLWPRQARQYTTVNGARVLPLPVPDARPSVAPTVRSARKKHRCTSTTSRPATAPRCAWSTSTTPPGGEDIDGYEVPAENPNR
ncbi:hypothetical protein ACIF8W_28300 [Streptomyces sp. NPDC085639]|uniref:hypothetical protein n=1 Tax=Streptomyces sp. NPDC085639 TaxID=3365734 RepID=UPI0037D4E2A9